MPRTLTAEERKLIDELCRKHRLGGEARRTLASVAGAVRISVAAAQVLEIATLFVATGATASATAFTLFFGAQAFAGALLPVIMVIRTIDAMKAGDRIFSALAVAYTTTTWAFGRKPCPPKPSAKLVSDCKKGIGYPDRDKTGEAAWNAAAKKTVALLEGEVARHPRLEKATYQALLCAFGHNEPHVFCYKMCQALERKFATDTEKKIWRSRYENWPYPD